MSDGNFSSNPKTEWLSGPGDDRKMKLLEEFWYADPKGRKWVAPKDSVIDGASIPEALWSTVGSPYTGDYRRASITHDVACRQTGVSRDEADQMFYHACISGGCSVSQARILYAGVRVGAWVKNAFSFDLDMAGAHQLPFNTQSDHTKAVRAKFSLISLELSRTAPMTFDELRDFVNARL